MSQTNLVNASIATAAGVATCAAVAREFLSFRTERAEAERRLGYMAVPADVHGPTLDAYYYYDPRTSHSFYDPSFGYGAAGVSDLPSVSLGCHGSLVTYTSIAQVAIDRFNEARLGARDARSPEVLDHFMAMSEALLAGIEVRTAPGAGPFGVWPFEVANPWFPFSGGRWVSGLTSGVGLSVLLRAYQVSGDSRFLEASDVILAGFLVPVEDGGVAAHGTGGPFFEEVPSFPPTEILNGHVFALFGLHDHYRVTGSRTAHRLFTGGVAGLKCRLPNYAGRFWSRYDGGGEPWAGLAPPFYQRLHAIQLRALARMTSDVSFERLADQWDEQSKSPAGAAAYLLGRQWYRVRRRLVRRRFEAPTPSLAGSQEDLAPASSSPADMNEERPRRVLKERICICASGYPVAGGVSSVLSELLPSLREQADVVMLAWRGDRPLEQVRYFHHRWCSPHRFPTVLLYVLVGSLHLYRLHRRRPFTHFLAQDGTYTAAYCLIVGRLCGVPVSIMDHGTAWVITSDYYWRHRRPQGTGRAGHLFDAIYRRLLRRLAVLGARRSSGILLVGDEVVDAYLALGADRAKIHRYVYPLDAGRYAAAEGDPAPTRPAGQHTGRPFVIGTVGRLTPEKATAELVKAALAALRDTGAEGVVRVAGDGPELATLESRYARPDQPVEWLGALEREEVATFLSSVDIFVYAGVEGTNLSMAVLEAMAAGCAVVGTTAPASNAWLLAGGRGLAVPARDGPALERAIARLIVDGETRETARRRGQDFVSRMCRPAAVTGAILDSIRAGHRESPCPA